MRGPTQATPIFLPTCRVDSPSNATLTGKFDENAVTGGRGDTGLVQFFSQGKCVDEQVRCEHAQSHAPSCLEMEEHQKFSRVDNR